MLTTVVLDSAAPLNAGNRSPLAPGGRIPSLDGLRAVSIAMVLIGHASKTLPPCFLSRPAEWITDLFPAHLGVSIFFVISGYLITGLLVREQDRSGRIDLKAFYVRRAFRILPPLYAYVAIICVLGAMGAIELKLSDVLTASLFVWNYIGGSNWFLAHTWSLSVEEQFYLFWPIALAIFGKRRGTWLAVAIIVLSPVVRVANYLLIPSLRGRIPIMGHTRVDMMMFGCLIALLAGSPAFLVLLQRLDAIKAHIIAAIVLFAIAPFAILRWQGAWYLPIGYTLDGICVSLLMTWCVRHPTRAVGTMLNCRPVAWVGTLSYSLYLWQQLFLAEDNHTWSGKLPLSIVCAFAAAIGSYYLIESPALQLRTWFTRDRRPAGPGI